MGHNDKIILCATDFSECSARALGEAAALAWRMETRRLHLVHVGPSIEHAALEAALDPMIAEALDKADEEASRMTRELAEHTAREYGLLVEPAFRCGNAAEEIAQYALQIRADYVFVGTQGRSGLERILLGSVAEQVLRRAPCTVIAVRARAAAGV